MRHSSAISLVFSCLAFGACAQGVSLEGAVRCIDRSELSETQYEALRRLEKSGEPVSQVHQPLLAKSSKLWKTTAIPVCWEDVSFIESFAQRREDVRHAIEVSWEKALAPTEIPDYKRVHFVGWTSCSEGNDKGIRIVVRDKQPRALVGTEHIGTRAGMTLNFKFEDWGRTPCGLDQYNLKACIFQVAVHEFGHALGLAHEQNRVDAPLECPADTGPDAVRGDLRIGAYDEYSVMNYCNKTWNNNGNLSAGDLAGIQWLYYGLHPEIGSASNNVVCAEAAVMEQALAY